MYPISSAAKALFEAEQLQVLRLTGTDENNTAISITDENVMNGGFYIDRYCCNGSRLEIGTAVASEMTLRLDNRQGQFSGIRFEGAELKAEVGVADWSQASPTITWVPCGYFTPDEQPRNQSTISIHALDRMMRFDRNVETITLPATIAELVGQACTACNVPFTQNISGFPNSGFTVTELPELQTKITYRQIIQWCAGIMASNAWIDWEGKLRFSWYGTNPNYVSTTENRFSSDLYEDDITITGVSYTNTQNVTITAGTNDYAFDLTGNYLVRGSSILTNIYGVVRNITYRPFSATVISAPYLWPMDAITFTDNGGADHTCVVTNVAFGLNSVTSLKGVGETAQTNAGVGPNSMTSAQAFLVEKAVQSTLDTVDESLTQQDIFNRLTENGQLQGLYMLNGQLYINASYLRSGTIDGAVVNAKLLNIVDANGNVIASFNNVITLGKTTDAHAEMDFNSFEIYDKDGNAFFSAGDNRNSSGVATLRQSLVGNGSDKTFYVQAVIDSVDSVKVNGTTTTAYSVSGQSRAITFTSAPTSGAKIVIIYKTQEPVYHYDLGQRHPNNEIGQYSVVEGLYNTASSWTSHAEGAYSSATELSSHAEGESTTASGPGSHSEGSNTTASGDGSHAEGWDTTASGSRSHAEGYGTLASGASSHAEGFYTIASGQDQHVSGRYNVSNANLAEIVGGGFADNNRGNIRALDWSGNETIAGALSVGDVATTRNGLGLGNTSGALPAANGGTGQTSLQAARNAMGLGNTTGALPVANGGTGATTAQAARANLGFGTEAMNFRVGNSTSTNQAFLINAKVQNSNYQSRYEHDVILYPSETGIGFYDSTDSQSIWTIKDLGDPVTVAHGGTGATDAATARTNLGITPANIGAATLGDIVLASGQFAPGNIEANARGSASITFSSVGTTNYTVICTPLLGDITCGVQSKTATSFTLFYRNNDSSARSGTVNWAIIKLP